MASPQTLKAVRRRSDRYPIVLPLRYQALDPGLSSARGTGTTLAIDSTSVLFLAERPLRPGLRVELIMDWPALLDNRIPLQMRLKGRIDRNDDQGTLMQIVTHEFRTRAKSPTQMMKGTESHDVPEAVLPAG